ncbi:MAG: glycosyltransferase [Bacteroidota bacterium]
MQKILQICNKPPWPESDGGAMAMLANLKGFSQAGFEVDCFYLSTPKNESQPASWPESLKDLYKPETVFVDTRIHPVNTLFNLANGKAFHASRFISKEAEKKLAEKLRAKSYDFVLLESIYMGVYLPLIKKYFSGTLIVRAHNVEHLLWKRVANEEKSKIRKTYLNIQVKRLKKFEISVLVSADIILAITSLDAAVMEKTVPGKKVFVLPYSYGGSYAQPADFNPEKPVFFHLGSMNWMPNQDGIRWLVKHAWPQVYKAFPGAILRLAGRCMPEDITKTHGKMGIEVLGEVADSHDFINSCDIMICPLFAGGGMRIKIVEALALGKPVFSTRIGAEGIEPTEQDAPVLFFSNESELLSLVGHASQASFNYRRRSASAIALVKETFGREKLYQQLAEFINFEKKPISAA